MKVEGTKELEATRQTVWEVLNDPAQMAQLMPGVEGFEVADDRHWQAKVKIPLGLGGLRMTIDFEKIEERPPEFAQLNAKGKGVGALLSMQTQFHLSGEGEHTTMRWEADVKIAGPVGSMGQRVLQPIVNQQVGNVLNALEKQVEAASRGAAPTSEGAEPGGAGPEGAQPERAQPESAEPQSAEPETAQPESAGPEGAEEGIHPGSPETYESEPQGPTHSTEDRG